MDTEKFGQLLTAHWNAAAAKEAAIAAEAAARMALADFLCENDEEYRNKTIQLSGGYKLKQEVKKSVSVDKSHPQYPSLTQLLTSEQLNAVIKSKMALSYSLTGYNSLPPEIRAQIAPFVSVKSTVSIAYEKSNDNR